MFQHKLKRSGISYRQELEWIFAAQWAHYKLEEFEQLDGERQSVLVAAYRVSKQIEAVLGEDARIRGERARVEAQAEQMSRPRWR